MTVSHVNLAYLNHLAHCILETDHGIETAMELGDIEKGDLQMMEGRPDEFQSGRGRGRKARLSRPVRVRQ